MPVPIVCRKTHCLISSTPFARRRTTAISPVSWWIWKTSQAATSRLCSTSAKPWKSFVTAGNRFMPLARTTARGNIISPVSPIKFGCHRKAWLICTALPPTVCTTNRYWISWKFPPMCSAWVRINLPLNRLFVMICHRQPAKLTAAGLVSCGKTIWILLPLTGRSLLSRYSLARKGCLRV